MQTFSPHIENSLFFQGNLEFIRTATKYDLQMVNKRDSNGSNFFRFLYSAISKVFLGATSAFYAARGGSLPCLQYLVDKTRADVNSLTNKGHSLLHVASLEGHTAVTQWLLTKMKKNSIYQISQDAATAFHYAACKGLF